jgi:hypothetical protein
MLSIEFEPLSLGKIRGIEDIIPPMRVIIAAGTDEDHIFPMRNADFGMRNSKPKSPRRVFSVIPAPYPVVGSNRQVRGKLQQESSPLGGLSFSGFPSSRE